MLFLVPTSPAQDSAQPAAVITAQAASVVPHLIKFSGALPGAPNNTSVVDVKFALYAAQTGGDPLWSEMQQVSLDPTGKYSVLLGSVTTLPDSVFAQGQARWIGVTLGSEQESARSILVATPYSLKASDSETLGGHPASDFTLKNALAPGGTDITQINVGNGVTGGGTGPTVTLGLSNSYLQSLGNEIFAQLGANNTLTGSNAFGAGKVTIGGSPALSVASVSASSPITVTPSGGNITIGLSDSGLLTLGNSVYAQLGAANTFTKVQTFASGQTFPGTVSLAGNNTFSGSNTFSKAITFASGQTFPGTGTGTITGITTTSPLSGSGTSGSVALSLNTSALETTLNGVYPQLSASNTFSGSNTFSKAITFASGQTFPGTVSLSANNTFTGSDTFSKAITFASGQTFPGTGTITGVTAGTGLTGGGSSGAVTLNVNAAALESTYNSVYAGLASTNNFTGHSNFNTNDDNPALTTTGFYGIIASANIVGIIGDIVTGLSSTGQQYQSLLYTVGVQGDSSASGDSIGAGLLATADDGIGAIVANNSPSGFYALDVEANDSTSEILVAYNNATGDGCTLSADASLFCDGGTSVVHSLGDRKVATYGVQAAENWIEDAGSGQLTSGHTHISLDGVFGKTVNTALEYHVFLTPEGDCKGLYVAAKSDSGFDVRELSSGKSNIAFSYRIMAKRKGYESVRMEDITAKMNADKARRKVVHSSAAKHSRPAAPALRDAKP
jgi:hypothetical protein